MTKPKWQSFRPGIGLGFGIRSRCLHRLDVITSKYSRQASPPSEWENLSLSTQEKTSAKKRIAELIPRSGNLSQFDHHIQDDHRRKVSGQPVCNRDPLPSEG